MNKNRIKVFGEVVEKDGIKSLKILNKERYFNFISSFEIGTSLELKLRPINDRRSEEQNNYYWAIVRIIAGELGYEVVDELHEVLKTKFNNGKSTTDFSPTEFAAYIQSIVIWASTELQIDLPSQDKI